MSFKKTGEAHPIGNPFPVKKDEKESELVQESEQGRPTDVDLKEEPRHDIDK